MPPSDDDVMDSGLPSLNLWNRCHWHSHKTNDGAGALPNSVTATSTFFPAILSWQAIQLWKGRRVDTQRWIENSAIKWICLCLGLSCLQACSTRRPSEKASNSKLPPTSASILSEEKIVRIKRFCGDCHPVPMAASFPKSSWDKEVQQGFNFYHESKRTDLEEPRFEDVVRYFRDAAPDAVIVPRADQMAPTTAPVRFVRGSALAQADVAPFTAHLVWNPASQSILHTDMLGGTLREWKPKPDGSKNSPEGVDTLVARGRSICRVHLCDWNADGRQDYLLGDLGRFPVGDHHQGRVVLQLALEVGQYESVILADNLARVVEAKPFDYDEDGDLDVLVAEFGWLRTGGLKLLRNQGGTSQDPEMEVEVLDPRHGSLGVEIADLDGDSKLDFVVSFGQEFETVEAYMNLGAGKFDKKVLLRLPDPSYNSSSFQIVDVDGDGLIDIVHTCGDIMDTYIPKPYHGLRWIRNLGNGSWEVRELGLLVGALQSTVADFDGDGDLDIAAVGLFQHRAANNPGAYDSICWWEQRDQLEFTRHSIERDQCSHASCTSADVNGDGRIDLIVGECRDAVERAAFRVFLNLPAE